MNSGELLNIEPLELKFLFELKKQMSCSLKLSNKTSDHVAFKVKVTNQKRYCVRPCKGIIQPCSTCDVTVTMQAQNETPITMECKDKFLIQRVIASPDTETGDLNLEIFDKKLGHAVEEFKLKVIYDSLRQQPSTIEEHLHGVSATGPLVKSSSILATLSTQVEALTSKLQEMKNNAIKAITKNQNELEKPLLTEYHDKSVSPELIGIEN